MEESATFWRNSADFWTERRREERATGSEGYFREFRNLLGHGGDFWGCLGAGLEFEMRRRRAWLGIRGGGGDGKGRLVTGQVRLPPSSQRWIEERSKV